MRKAIIVLACILWLPVQALVTHGWFWGCVHDGLEVGCGTAGAYTERWHANHWEIDADWPDGLAVYHWGEGVVSRPLISDQVHNRAQIHYCAPDGSEIMYSDPPERKNLAVLCVPASY